MCRLVFGLVGGGLGTPCGLCRDVRVCMVLYGLYVVFVLSVYICLGRSRDLSGFGDAVVNVSVYGYGRDVRVCM